MREKILSQLNEIKDMEAALQNFRSTAERLLNKAKENGHILLAIQLEELIKICGNIEQDVECMKKNKEVK